MKKISRIVTFRWEEPSEGIAVEVWSLTSMQWRTILKAAEWVAGYLGSRGDEYGSTIPSFTIEIAKAAGGDIVDFNKALQRLADNFRYSTQEDLYDVVCPIFAGNGIKR